MLTDGPAQVTHDGRETELLEMSESMLREVLGRIRPEDADCPVPEMWAGVGPMTMTQARELHAGWTVPPGADLLCATIERCLLAHYVAAFLGSTACPLPEELARPLWELTVPQAQQWRERGHFRPPMPLPDHVSWRDRFLLDAGHEPHPAGH